MTIRPFRLNPAAALAIYLALSQVILGQTQATSPDTAAIQAKIAAERVAIGKAIATRDAATLSRYWSPDLIVNGPGNTIVSRSQILGALNNGGVNYTSLKGTPEYFTVINGTAVLMSHEDLVPASGPMAGKHLIRRTTDIYKPSGDDWTLVARQATYVGLDGATIEGSGVSTFSPPPSTPETDAIRAQITANGRAVGRAIGTMDFGALEKVWSPAMVVNSPGNNILTRDQVFAAMREDKLK